MRRPTAPEVLFAWWRAALAGEAPPANPDEPQCGFFECRLVRGGPLVAARIWMEQEIDPETGELLADEALCCEVAGERRDPAEEWSRLCARPIGEALYYYRCDIRRWAAWHAPQRPEANPRRPIDFSILPPPF